MPKYIDSLDVDSILDGRSRRDLFDDGSGYQAAIFDRTCERASDLARAAASNAGYATGEGDEHDSGMVRVLALSAFIHLAYGRKQRAVPDSTSAMLGNMLEAVRVGDLPIPDMSVSSEAAAHGGGDFSNGGTATSLTGSDACPVFSDLGSEW